MTLTTEQIEQVIDDCRKGAAMRGLFNKWIVEEMASELLRCRDRIAELSAVASLEAQPVGYFVRHRSAWGRPSKWRLWTECSAEDYAEFCKIIATGEDDAGRFYEARILYDAPPAPAVNAAPDFEAWFNSPEAGLRVVNFHIQHELQKKAWEACRAAMLAQHVSGGYTLPPHVFRELVNSLRDIAVKYSGTDQLRERLNTALHQFIEPDHPHTRTASLEGSCD